MSDLNCSWVTVRHHCHAACGESDKGKYSGVPCAAEESWVFPDRCCPFQSWSSRFPGTQTANRPSDKSDPTSSKSTGSGAKEHWQPPPLIASHSRCPFCFEGCPTLDWRIFVFLLMQQTDIWTGRSECSDGITNVYTHCYQVRSITLLRWPKPKIVLVTLYFAALQFPNDFLIIFRKFPGLVLFMVKLGTPLQKGSH